MEINFLAKETNTDSNTLKRLLVQAPFLYSRGPRMIKGKLRKIAEPYIRLKRFQVALLPFLVKNIKLPHYLHGGIPGRSIITNAKPHLNKKWVVCLDIQNFFPSIRPAKLEIALTKFLPAEIAKNITRLTTSKHELPQGAPASPFLSNLALLSIDDAVYQLCKTNHLIYTRYFDDLTISGNGAPSIVDRVEKIIERSGFKPKKSKRKEQRRGQEQLVTGLSVSGKTLSIPEKTLLLINATIEKIQRDGLAAFGNNFIKEKDRLKGYISFLNQADPLEATKYSSLLKEILLEDY